MELTKLQRNRKEKIEKSLNGLYTNRELALELSITIGHAKTIKRRYRQEGEKSLVHGNTGRKPRHAISDEEKSLLLKIKEQTNKSGKKIFENVNFSHFRDILEDVYGIKRSRNTISKILKEAGYKSPKIRRSHKEKTIHERRPKREKEGELLQGDATPFEWFEDGHKYALHAFIDDATKKPTAMYMTKNECAFGYNECLRYTILHKGRPKALYLDKLSVFFNNRKLTIEEQLQGKEKSATQFAQSCKELGIELIAANSPQAKGRVERFWDVVQSRLPVELKLRDITTVEGVNEFLPTFMKMYAKWFGEEPKSKESAFLPPTDEQKIELAKILAVKIQRKTDSGCIFSLKNYLFKVPHTPNQHIMIYLSVKDGIYGITKNGKRVELELFDDDSSGNAMPEVWKDLIEEYFYKDAKAKYRLSYKEAS